MVRNHIQVHIQECLKGGLQMQTVREFIFLAKCGRAGTTTHCRLTSWPKIRPSLLVANFIIIEQFKDIVGNKPIFALLVVEKN